MQEREPKAEPSPIFPQEPKANSEFVPTQDSKPEAKSDFVPTSEPKSKNDPEPVSESGNGGHIRSNPEQVVKEASAPADGAGFWRTLLTRLRGKLDIGSYSLVSGPGITGELSGGILTVVLEDNPFIRGILESSDVSLALQQEAAALAGRPVKLALATRGAASGQPDIGKLGELSKFSNFKFE